MRDVLIVGAGGFATEVLGYVEEHGGYRVAGVLDDRAIPDLLGHPVTHPDRYTGPCRRAILAVGYPDAKPGVVGRYAGLGLAWETFVHPAARVSRHATLGPGCVIAPLAVVSGNPTLGAFVLLNALAAVGHHATVGDYCSLMPHSAAAGGSKLGAGTLVSIGASVLPNVTVGDGCQVSAGAVVTREMPAASLVFGNPARPMPLRRRHDG